MASLEYQEHRWSATTTDADGDVTLVVYGPDPLAAMSELAEALVVEMGERDERNRVRVNGLCERIERLEQIKGGED